MDPGKTRNPWNARHTPGGSSSGLRRGGGGRARAGGDRHADQRLGHPAGGVLRRGRLQADGRRDSVRRRAICSARRSTRSARSRAPWPMPRCSRARSPSRAHRAAVARARDAAAARLPARLSVDARCDCDADDALDAAVDALARRAARRSSPVALPDAWHEANAHASHDHAVRGRAQSGRLQERERARLRRRSTPRSTKAARSADGDYRAALEAARARDRRSSPSGSAPFDAVVAPPAPGAAPKGLAATGDPSCCTLWSLLGFPAITLPVGVARDGCRWACSSPRPQATTIACWPSPRGAKRGCRSRTGVSSDRACSIGRHEARQAACAAAASQAAQSGRALAAARKGGPHGKSTRAKRRQANVELQKRARDPHAESDR